jgi:hypothetical protein
MDQPQKLALPVAAIALAGFYLPFCFGPPISGKRAADVVTFLEFPSRASPDETFVRAGIDQFSFTGAATTFRFGFGTVSFFH